MARDRKKRTSIFSHVTKLFEKKRASRHRSLRVEALEPRQLLSVSSPPEELLPGNRTLDVQLGGIDADERIDLVGLNADGTLTVALNEGEDNWESVESLDLGIGPAHGLRLTDFNNDAKLDVVVQTPDSIVLALGDGSGGFSIADTYSSANPGELAPSDGNNVGVFAGMLDGDFFSDLAFVVPGANEVWVIRGHGDGTLATPERYGSGGSEPVDLIGGQFIGDSRADLAVGHADGSLSFLEGQADGSFLLRNDLAIEDLGSIAGLTAADYDSDGDTDIAVSGGTRVTILSNDNDVYTQSPIVNGDFSTGLTGWEAETEGVSGLGSFAELVEGDRFLTSLKQTFVIPAGAEQISFDLVSLGLESPVSGEVPDAFEASLLDASFQSLVRTFRADSTSFFNANPDGEISFASGVTFDGRTVTLDISQIAAGTEVTLYFDLIGNPPGQQSVVHIDNVRLTPEAIYTETFSGGLLSGPFGNTEGIATADVDGDGELDLIVADSGRDELLVFNGDGAGNFVRSELDLAPFGGQPLGVDAANFTDGDAIADPVVALSTGILNPLFFSAGNTPPVITTANNVAGNEGEEVVFTATFEDIDVDDTHTAVIDWGDGATSFATVTFDGGTGTIEATHIYADNGQYDILLSLMDSAGGTANASTMATIGNVAPTVVAIADPTIEEGSLLSVDLATFSDPGFTNEDAGTEETFDAEIDWGDGQTSAGAIVVTQGAAGVFTTGTVSGEHVYLDNGTYTAQVTVTDDDGESYTAQLSVTVTNAPPAVESAEDLSASEGVSAEFTATFSNPGVLDTHAATIDWGDGTTSAATIRENDGQGTITAQHIYADNGTYTVRLTLTDDDGGQVQHEVVAVIDNVAPSLTPAGDQIIAEGEFLTLNLASFSDPGFTRLVAGTAETFTAEIDWGDGTVEEGTIDLTQGSEGILTEGTVFGSHVYADDGDYLVTVAVQDDDGGQAAGEFNVEVTNQAPVFRTLNTLAGSEGDPVELVGTFFDAGPLDTHEATIDWGDGTFSAATIDQQNRTITASHIYADNGNYTVTVVLTDDDGGETTRATSAVIDNVAPSLNAYFAVEIINDGSGPQLVGVITGNFSDPGFDRPEAPTAETFTVTVEWGDGTTEDVEFEVDAGSDGVPSTGTFLAKHVFAGGLTYSVKVTVRDDDGGMDMSESFTFRAGRIDVKPTLNLKSQGVIPVEIFAESDFNPHADLDVDSLRFGPAGADEAHGQLHSGGKGNGKGNGKGKGKNKNSDEPASGDAVAHFETQESGIRPSDTFVVLVGRLTDGTLFLGTDGIKIAPGSATGKKGVTEPETSPGLSKFFVVDAGHRTAYKYLADGSNNGVFALDTSTNDPRGATANTLGTTLWTVDASGQVGVQQNDGTPLGNWTAFGVEAAEGIANNGTDLFIVDTFDDEILRYGGAAGLTFGAMLPTANFSLHVDNSHPSGLTTDGETLWVIDDAAKSVFVYDVDGNLVGRWKLDPANRDPSGITIGGGDLFVVDRAGLVYAYEAGIGYRSGNQSADGTFTLTSGNASPEGIADPAEPITIGELVEDSIAESGQINEYTFMGSAGQFIYFDAIPVDYASNFRWELRSPSDNIMFSLSGLYDPGILELPEDGVYLLTVEGRFGRTGKYNFQLSEATETITETIALGQTVSATISSLPELHHYSFNAAANQRISLNTDFNANLEWVIKDPTGDRILYRSNLSRNYFDLNETGTYDIFIHNDDKGLTGSYSFSLHDITPSPQAIDVDGSIIGGDIQFYGEEDIYTFEASAGQWVWFDKLLGNEDHLEWRLDGPNGFIFRRDLYDVGVYEMQVEGAYTLTVKSQYGEPGTYEFRLVDFPAPSEIPLVFGQTYDGTVAENLDVHFFTFEANEGDRLAFDVASDFNAELKWTLRDPSGFIQFDRNLSDDYWDLYETGTWELVVQNYDGQTGSYEFRVVDITPTPQPIDVGVPISGTISLEGEEHVYTFHADAGQLLSFDAVAENTFVDWELYSPNEDFIFGESFEDAGTYTMPETGEYRLTFSSFALFLGPQNYEFQVSEVAPARELAINLNEPVSGDIATSPELHRFTFDADAGDRIYLDSDPDSNFELSATLRDPNGQQPFAGLLEVLADTGPLELTTSGTYTLDVSNYFSGTGSYNFVVWQSSIIDQGLFAIGDPVSGSIGTPGDEHVFAFEGSAGAKLFADVAQSSFYWSIETPSGDVLLGESMRDKLGIVLPEDGIFRVRIFDFTDDTGAYEFTLQAVPAPLEQNIDLDQEITETVTVPGERHIYYFDVAAGQRVYFQSMSGGDDYDWSLVGPDGTTLLFTDDFDDIDTIILEEGGTYSLRVDANSTTTGDYTFRLVDVPTPEVRAIEIDEVVTGEITVIGEEDHFTFHGDSGQLVFFDSQVELSQRFHFDWELLAPSGQSVFILGRRSFLDISTLELPETGTYTLIIDGRDRFTEGYQFQLWDVPPDVTQPLPVNTAVSESLVAGQTQTYTFEVEENVDYVLDVRENESFLNFDVYDPSGNQIYRDDQGTFLEDLAPGTYEVVVGFASSDKFGPYTFRIQEVVPARVGALDNLGMDFWLAMQTQFDSPFGFTDNPDMSLHITSQVDTSGAVMIPGRNFYTSFDVAAGEVATVMLPDSAEVGGYDSVSNKGIHVTALDDVAVYGLNYLQHTTDAFLGLPTDVLGLENINLSYPATGGGGFRFVSDGTGITVVATEEDTTLTITPTENHFDHPAGIPYTVTLNRGQTYNLLNLYGQPPYDLSGTVIEADKPVAVFGGHRCTEIPQGLSACDHLTEHLPPVEAWGREFLSVPLATRLNGDRFRFVASEDGTEVRVNGELVTTLNRSEVHEMVIEGMAQITATAPILVGQFSHSSDWDGVEADPFYMLITPHEQFLASYTVSTPTIGFPDNFLNIVAPNEAVGQITVDGELIPVEDFSPIGNSGFSGAQVNVSVGAHTLDGPLPFGVSVYGFAFFDSYGYPGGMLISPINSVTDVTLAPETASLNLGSEHIVTATLTDDAGDPVVGVRVDFIVDGVNPIQGFGLTDEFGQAQFSYLGESAGIDFITARVGGVSDVATVEWAGAPASLTIVSPPNNSLVPTGSILITGSATAGGPSESIIDVAINGVSVDALDVAGNFFGLVDVGLGNNVYTVEATTSLGAIVTRSLTLFGVQPTTDLESDELQDVTLSGSLEYRGTTFNRATHNLLAQTSLTNIGDTPIDGPIAAVFQNFSSPVVDLASAEGTREENPFVAFDTEIGSDGLNPGGTSSDIGLTFANQSMSRFDFDVSLLGLGNGAPSFTSPPVIDAAIDTPYVYAADARDPDGSEISFRLEIAPEGMSVDANTGLVSWTPQADQLGSHQVVLVAEDGRGGSSQQLFNVFVQSEIANRPPVFQSAPPTEIDPGSDYSYQPAVFDADGDTLQFFLEDGPAGMTIDSVTGLVMLLGTTAGSYAVSLRAEDGQGGSATQTYVLSVGEASANPGAPQIFSTPPTETTAGDLYVYRVNAADPENDPLTFSLLQAPDGMVIDPTTGRIDFTANAAQVGSHTVEIKVDDSLGGVALQTYSLNVRADAPNRAPMITSQPALFVTQDEAYDYQVEASDPDQDTLTFDLVVAPAGMTMDANTGAISWTPTAADLGTHRVLVRVTDAEGAYGLQNFDLDVRSPNVAPEFVSDPVVEVVFGKTYRYDAVAIDAEDAVSYSLIEAPEGMLLDPNSGIITWRTANASVGNHTVTIRAIDERGLSTDQAFAVAVLPDEAGPNASISFSTNFIDPGEEVTITVGSNDPSGIDSVVLTINGEEVPLDNRNTKVFTATDPGLTEVTAVVTDGAGNTTTVTEILRVFDPTDTEGPQINITSPEPGSVITYLTDIVGSVHDENLEFYRLQYSLTGTEQWTTFAEGSENVSNDVLGTFDPTMLRNDQYDIRVWAQDVNGQQTFLQFPLSITANAKLGNFRLEFSDLQIPVVGVPITINRVYDTLQANESGDFGFGWSLSIADPKFRETVPQTEAEKLVGIFGAAPFKRGTRVYLTGPDGRRLGYTFDPVLAEAQSVFGPVWSPHFRPDPGVYEQLEVDHIPLMQNEDGTFELYLFGVPYNPSEYTLVTKNQLHYRYSQIDGLQDITDRNGNVLEFRDDGIFASSGQSIEFIRDEVGRIREIVDPAGNALVYQYDDHGDLVSVSDQEQNTSTYKYLTEPEHYLQEIVSPSCECNGINYVRNEYDEHGRIVANNDAAGNQTTLSYDLSSNTEVVYDRRGKPTEITYDTRGNILSATDALGHATTYTYDIDDNVTSVTDARNHSTHYDYDTQGNVTYIIDPSDGTWSFSYNAFTDPLSVVDAEGRLTRFEYDTNGNATRVVDANGDSMQFTHDSKGRITSIRDRRGEMTSFEYLAGTNLISKVTNAQDVTTEAEYNFYGLPTRLVDENGHDTRISYDALGRIRSITDANEMTTYFTWDFNRLESQTDQNGHTTSFEYDALGRRISEIDPLGRKITYTYDADGRITSGTDENGRTIEYEYDDAGRLISESVKASPDIVEILITMGVADPLIESRHTYELDAAGNRIRVVDSNGNETRYEYDSLNRMTRSVDSLAGEQRYSYDAVGNMVAWTDELGRSYHYSYDNLNRLIQTRDPLEGRILREYDEAGNLISYVDQNSRSTRYEYDELGRLVRMFDGEDGQWLYEYDNAGNQTSAIDAEGRRTVHEYDALNRLIKTIDAEGGQLVREYDSVGNLKTLIDQNDHSTRFIYNELNQLTRIVNAHGDEERFTYDASGQMTSWTDELGRTTKLLRNLFGQVVVVENAQDQRELYHYDGETNLISYEDVLGRQTTYEYDALNRLTARSDPDSFSVSFQYDAVGNLIQETDQLTQPTRYDYDGLNRVVRITDPVGAVTTFEHDSVGNVLSMTDALGRVTKYEYDKLDRLILSQDARGAFTQRSYDKVGNLVSYVDPSGNESTFSYDGLDRMILETNELGYSRGYEYDAVGNITKQTDRMGRVRSFTYDALDRLTDEVWLQSGAEVNHVEFEYDKVGNIVSGTDAFSNYTYSYDTLDRLKNVTANNFADLEPFTLAYVYDAYGNIISVEDDFGTRVSSSYNARNLLESRAWSGGGVDEARIELEYSKRGELIGIERYVSEVANPETFVGRSSYSYDNAGRIAAIRHRESTDEILAEYDYTWDLANQLVAWSHHGRVISYEHDETGQLIAASSEDLELFDEQYSYDENGNRVGDLYVTGSNNQLLSDETFDYLYDAEGNLSTKTHRATGEVTNFVYDHRNRLVRTSRESAGGILLAEVSYVYDIFDRRIEIVADADGVGPEAASITRMIYDGKYVWADLNGDGDVIAKYLYGDQIDQILARWRDGEGTAWYLADHLGTIRDIADSSGSVVDTIEYDSFGRILAESNPSFGDRYKYTGREWDGISKLYYYRARYYDPTVGRFLSYDPLSFNAGDANLYRYVQNRPLIATDPTGLATVLGYAKQAWKITQAAGGITSMVCGSVDVYRAWKSGDKVGFYVGSIGVAAGFLSLVLPLKYISTLAANYPKVAGGVAVAGVIGGGYSAGSRLAGAWKAYHDGNHFEGTLQVVCAGADIISAISISESLDPLLNRRGVPPRHGPLPGRGCNCFVFGTPVHMANDSSGYSLSGFIFIPVFVSGLVLLRRPPTERATPSNRSSRVKRKVKRSGSSETISPLKALGGRNVGGACGESLNPPPQSVTETNTAGDEHERVMHGNSSLKWFFAVALMLLSVVGATWLGHTTSYNEPATCRIGEVQVGDRVIGINPLGSQRNVQEPDATWYHLKLYMKRERGQLSIELLRPREWIDALNVEEGKSVDLNLAEFDATGPAKVLSISPSPQIKAGNGPVVTGRFAHEITDNLVNVRVEGEPEPIGVTENHRFWSADREDFIAAKLLRSGERVVTVGTELASVISVTPRNEAVRVFNIEVHREHVFHVGRRGILVHNTSASANGLAYNGVVNTYAYMKKIFGSGKPGGGLGIQPHHLNQFAVYGENIALNDGLTTPLVGAVADAGSEHSNIHQWLEDIFFDRYREGGDLYGQRPRNSDYDQALREALEYAGATKEEADALADAARQERINAGYLDDDLMPVNPLDRKGNPVTLKDDFVPNRVPCLPK